MSQSPFEVTTLAYLCTVQRPDGVGFAATSHDQRPSTEGASFHSEINLQPVEVLLTDDMLGSRFVLRASSDSANGATSDLFDDAWTGATIRMLAYDWSSNGTEALICEGGVGERKISDGMLEMSVDVLPAALGRPPCIQTSPECRAVLGDQKCRIDMRSRKCRAKVLAVQDAVLVIDEGELSRFRMGRLRWLSGVHCGIEQIILDVDGERLVLQDGVREGTAAGDRVILTEGCDGRRTTCAERFGNIHNFRAEPDLPGSDILLRFPGA